MTYVCECMCVCVIMNTSFVERQLNMDMESLILLIRNQCASWVYISLVAYMSKEHILMKFKTIMCLYFLWYMNLTWI